ncbi:MAG TPA: M48 family metalloprotease [Steroidobacteraceae bacterium]|jgi:predicted Zn-dependent protease|nr:M48 family metalloprotease [Steroidobacteraceae bacterium]
MGKLAAVTHGPTAVKRLLAVIFVVAWNACTTLALAAEPPPAPAPPQQILMAPSAGSDLPDLGSPAETILSHRDEYGLGAMVAKELRDQNALIDDPEVYEYINGVGQRLAAQSSEGGNGFEYNVIKDTDINAFAVPGGFVFINAGLVLATEQESELAAVMAHETAHVTQHHIARAIRAQSQQSLMTAAALIAAVLLGAAGGGQATEGAIAAAEGLAVQQQINFTRDNEYEADRVGIGFLAGAGYDPTAMATFFETTSRHEGLAATYIPAMLVDHPVTTDRIAEARARAAQFPARTGTDSQSYPLIRERVRVLVATGDTDMAAQYAQKIAHGEDTLANRYGEALVLMNSAHPEEAVKLLQPMVQQHQGLTLLYAALGQAQARAGHMQEALATFKHAEALFPRNVPITQRYAEALMADNRGAEAHNMLLDLFNNVPPTPEQIRLTARAASAAGDQGDAYYYMGEYQIANGDLLLASQQLQLALTSPHISAIQRARYRARLDEVREYLASQKKRQLASDTGDQGGQRGGR